MRAFLHLISNSIVPDLLDSLRLLVGVEFVEFSFLQIYCKEEKADLLIKVSHNVTSILWNCKCWKVPRFRDERRATSTDSGHTCRLARTEA